MVDSSQDPEDVAYRLDLESIRTSAKWLVAAFAALGTVLIAGSQLSSIGSLKTTDGRFWAAVVGMAVALVAVLAMVWQTVGLLIPQRITVDELARMETEKGRKSPAIRWFEANPSYKPYDTFLELQQAWRAVGDETTNDKPDLALLEPATRKVQRLAVMATATAQFRRMMLAVAAAAAVAAGGIGVFAWAANPSAPAAPPAASLRNLDLSGSNLRGAGLQHADLSGVDFTGSNLRGANLNAAVVKGVVWKNTTCPDGTNSDDHAKRGGSAAAGTCEGHLVP
jgi:Pentapeptide repeats (8 copies)